MAPENRELAEWETPCQRCAGGRRQHRNGHLGHAFVAKRWTRWEVLETAVFLIVPPAVAGYCVWVVIR